MKLPAVINTDKQTVVKNFNAAADAYDATAVLQKAIAEQLVERLDLVRLVPGKVLDLGSGTGFGAKLLEQKFRKAEIVQIDFAERMVSKSKRTSRRWFSRQYFVCADAQALPFRAGEFEMVYSNLMLQWCNEPGPVFAEIRRACSSGGLFVFSSFGPDTLRELRECWSLVDDDIHVNTFLDMHDVGDALVRAGFEHPVMESEYFTMTYNSASKIFTDLKLQGATNANLGRRSTLTGKERLMRVVEAYEKFRIDGRLPVTYEVIYGHAWKSRPEISDERHKQEYAIPLSSIGRIYDRSK